jgi:hypothetical protein
MSLDPHDLPIFEELDDRFYVAPSTVPGAGDGLFAKVALAKGERLRVVGVRLRAKSAADLCTRYADTHKFRAGEDLLIPVGFGGMVNHSADPNMEKIVEAGNVYLQTLRVIAAGEELFFTYSAYAQERFGLA